jgi:NAD(P)-dependent dehydrogenase (short-subunit alcohol dehydrogenase family)
LSKIPRHVGCPQTALWGSSVAYLLLSKMLTDIGSRFEAWVNTINPGWIRTDRLPPMLESQAARRRGNFEAATEEIVRKVNVVRLGESFLLDSRISTRLQYTIDRER